MIVDSLNKSNHNTKCSGMHASKTNEDGHSARGASALFSLFPPPVSAMPLITDDEGRLVFVPSAVTPSGMSDTSAAPARNVPPDCDSHLAVRQNVLLELARADQDRACCKRGRDDEEGGTDVNVVGQPLSTHFAAAADAGAPSCDGVEHGSPSEVPIYNIPAPSAGASRADGDVHIAPAYSDAVRAVGDAAQVGGGTAVAVLNSQGGSELLSSGISGGLHFHLHVDNGDRPALAAGWQARGVKPELASLLAELSVSEYHNAEGSMVSEVCDCMLVEPGTFGTATSRVTESAVALVRLADSIAIRVDSARSLRSRRSVSWADTTWRRDTARSIAAVATAATPPALFTNSTGVAEGAAARLEREQRSAEMHVLLSVVPVKYHALCVGATEREWAKYPLERRTELLTRHLCSFSAGSLAGCRRALLRLHRWLLVNNLSDVCEDYNCSGATLSWFGIDEQKVSRGGGRTVIHALRSGLDFGRRHLALAGLQTDNDAFVNVAALPPRPPTPAKAVTVAVYYHLLWLSRHGCRIGSLYASLLVTCCIAALRVRDAQRAALRFSLSGLDGGPECTTLAGTCYTSKHPKRRAAMPMPFFVVAWPSHAEWYAPAVTQCCGASGESNGRDYLFPALRVPRRKTFGDEGVVVLDAPARSATVIAVLRWLLTLPPLSYTKKEAATFSGHSMRHFMPTLARFMALPEEDRLELARWAATCDTRGRRHSMPNRYASEAESPRIFQIQRELFRRLDQAIGVDAADAASLPNAPVLPFRDGWVALQRALEAGADASDGQRFAQPDADVGAECSSSESDDD